MARLLAADVHRAVDAERWLPVVGYEGIYEVSDLGRVRSLNRLDAAGFRRKGKLKTQSFNEDGYRVVTLNKNGEQRQSRVHCLVLEAFIGSRPPGMLACHFPNPNVSDNRLSNLRWDSCKGNLADRKAHGTELIGSRNGRAKISEEDVLRAREMRKRGETFRAISESIGVSFSYARKIVVGDNWKHVSERPK